jgi:hypothetical protein
MYFEIVVCELCLTTPAHIMNVYWVYTNSYVLIDTQTVIGVLFYYLTILCYLKIFQLAIIDYTLAIMILAMTYNGYQFNFISKSFPILLHLLWQRSTLFLTNFRADVHYTHSMLRESYVKNSTVPWCFCVCWMTGCQHNLDTSIQLLIEHVEHVECGNPITTNIVTWVIASIMLTILNLLVGSHNKTVKVVDESPAGATCSLWMKYGTWGCISVKHKFYCPSPMWAYYNNM